MRAEARGRAAACALWLVLGALALGSAGVAGQGLRGADGNMLGASERLLSLQNSYSAAMAQAESLRAAWKSTLRPACRAASKTLCGTGNFESDQARDALMLAASPQAFDSRDPSEMGGFNPISPPGDQGDCNACVAFSIAAAAEAAVASVLRTGALGARTPRLSPRDLFFCGATGAEADCLYGWTFNQALAELAVRKQPLASWKCLPFEDVEDLPVSQLCKPLCAAPTSAPGAFSWTKLQPLVTISRVQQHIRDWGGVVTRLNLQPPFRGWFQGANRTAVYGGFPEDPSTEQGHAVLVVGYNNADNYWVIKNSWGTNWADGGFAKIRYGILGMMDPTFTFGITWTPAGPFVGAPPPPPLVPGPTKGCYNYKTRAGEYAAGIAFRYDVPLEGLLTDNAAAIPKMDALLQPGTQIKVCNPKRNVNLAPPPAPAVAAKPLSRVPPAAAAAPAAAPPAAAAGGSGGGGGSVCSPYMGCVPAPPSAAPPADGAGSFLGRRRRRLLALVPRAWRLAARVLGARR